MKGKLLPLAAVALALAGCGPSGIAVPGMGHRTVEQGFALLRSRGFRVSISGPFTMNPYLASGIRETIPAAGTHVPRGSTVTLVQTSGPSASPVYGPAPKHYPLPDFSGRSAAVAMRWAYHHVYWSISLPGLEGSTAPNLFAAYVVTGQRPAAGSRVSANSWLYLTVKPRR